jgi:heme exporter protein A
LTLAVEARGLVKWYGAQPALRGVDLSVAPGEVLVLLGPNGAGKTTLLRVLSGRVRPNAGTARIAGWDVAGEGDSVRRAVGVLAHGHQLYESLTARENLAFAAAMLGTDRSADRLSDLLARVGLDRAADLRVRGFSSGMKRRLALAKLMLREPRVILLDEPYAGLDLHATKTFQEFLMGAKVAGAGTVLATHNLTMGYGVADRLAVLHRGRVVLDARREETTIEELRALFVLYGEAVESA